MGAPMAMRLLSAGYAVTVWNRTPEKAEALAPLGATVATNLAEVASVGDVVITMLADGPAVSNVLFSVDVIEKLRAGTIVVDMSSVPPALARSHACHLLAREVYHLDSPVSGGTSGASDGTLAIMVGGAAGAYEAVRPILRAMGRPTWVGPSGSGQLAKLANQTIVAVTIAAVAEALLFTSAGGADPSKVKEALKGGFADSTILSLHGQRMIDRAWVPGGPTRLQVKDLRTLLEVAGELGVVLPIAAHVATLFEDNMEAGLGEYDHSALLLAIERCSPGARLSNKPDQVPNIR
jgi:2-hydroxy-3-oxopropionate reductase